MRVEAQTEIAAAPEAVWDVIADPDRAREVLVGVTRWDVEQPAPGQHAPEVRRQGLGARYRLRMLVGSAEVGGLVEVVEFTEHRDLAWTSVLGIEHRGRWRLREARPGRTCVTLRLAYSAPGGLLGLVSDRLAAPMVRANLRRSLDRLKRRVELSEGRRPPAPSPR